MAEVVYRGEGTEFPDFIAVDLRNGLVRFTVRGEPHPVPGEDGVPKLEAGATVTLVLKQDAVARLVHKLLSLPPIDDAIGAKPFVLYFDRASERQAFIDAMREHAPLLTGHSLDREKESSG